MLALLFFSLYYVLRGGRCEENIQKTLISFVVKPSQSREENFIIIVLKNVMTSVFITLQQRFQGRRLYFSSLTNEEKRQSKKNTKRQQLPLMW